MIGYNKKPVEINLSNCYRPPYKIGDSVNSYTYYGYDDIYEQKPPIWVVFCYSNISLSLNWRA